MPNTQGFELVSEVTVQVLRNILDAAWKSADDSSGEGVIPEKFEIPNGLNMGPYTVKEGTVQIPRDQLGLDMDTGVNGVDIKLGTIVHVEIDNPPIPSATFFDLTADIHIKTPIVTLDGDVNVGAKLENLPADSIVATITSGDPIGPITQNMVEEYVHEKLRNDPAFPTVYDNISIPFPPFSMIGRLELYDDESDPAKLTKVTFPQAGKVLVSIPCYMRFYDITGDFGGVTLNTPMGITGVIEMLADYSIVNDEVEAKLSEAVITLEDLTKAPGIEGSNYDYNSTLVEIGSDQTLEEIIKGSFNILAQVELVKIGDVKETVPSVSQIEDFIEEQIRNELNRRKEILIWEPRVPEDADVEISINDVTPQALNEGMAIAINDTGSGNAGAITFFVPADRDFATAISRSEVIDQLEVARFNTFGNLPTSIDPVEGHDVDLNSLEFDLKSGAIDINGEVTVKDAILGSIDVDADFQADVALRWIDNDDGTQKIDPFVDGDPDVDLSLLAWILSFLIGFITLGIVGVIVVLVVLVIAENLAERIGGEVVRDEVSDQITGIGAWPQTLSNIGTITSRFMNPIGIDSDGVLFSGTLIVTSAYMATSEDFAFSDGPYLNIGGQSLQFNGGLEKASSKVFWDFDDGNSSIIRKPLHIYGKSGLYIAKLRVEVDEEGGVTTRHFAKVKVQNVAPQVFMPPTITANEGEEVSVIAKFIDLNWLDLHTASIDWGDNSSPENLIVNETNSRPQAEGEVFACHAYCDDGTYEVKLTVRDDAGGIGIGRMTVIVKNVIPEVFLPDKINTLKGQCVHFEGAFEDAGWCDRHTGIWDMGDCHIRDAFIEQTNTKPKAKGTAKVRHVYQNCGSFNSKLTIIDDDNGVGVDSMIVHVNHLKNGNFEEGFYNLNLREGHEDIIANHWYPFASLVDTVDKLAISGQKSVEFDPQLYVVSQGQRSQNIKIRGAMRAGIAQQIDVNKGWDYEFSGQFHIPIRSSGRAVIGIDPLGGTDPDSSSVVWREVELSLQWKNATVRVTARSEKITLFLGLLHRKAVQTEIYWDACQLYQIQPYCNEVVCETTCIDFKELKEGIEVRKPFQYKGLSFIPGRQGVFTSTIGEPSGQVKLGFHREGMRIDFPEVVEDVKLTIANYAGRLIEIQALYNDEVKLKLEEIIYNETKIVEINDVPITGVVIRGGASEAALVEICLCLQDEIDQKEIGFDTANFSRRTNARQQVNVFENLTLD